MPAQRLQRLDQTSLDDNDPCRSDLASGQNYEMVRSIPL
jgi:hypothetical protein